MNIFFGTADSLYTMNQGFVIIADRNLIGANEGSRYMVYELEKEHKKSSLMCKKKEELVKEIMRLEHNVNVMNERLNVQANAIKHYEQESRNKAIDEFASELENHSIYADTGKGYEVKMEWVSPVTRIKEVAEQMKGAVQ